MAPAELAAGVLVSCEPTVEVEASRERRTHEILDKLRVSVGAVAMFSMVGLLVWSFSGGETQGGTTALQLPEPALAYAYPGMPYRQLPSQRMRGAYPVPVAVPAGQEGGSSYHNPSQYQQAQQEQTGPYYPAIYEPGRMGVPAMTEGTKPSGRSSTVVMADTQQQLPTDDMWWGDKEYPPSKVLGIGKNVPSVVFGVCSGIAFTIGIYSIAQSNLLNILSGSTVNGWYVLGALLVPYSWGLHVASWIQKQNGK